MSLRNVPFTDVARDVSGGNAKLPQSAFEKSGRLAVVDQGKDFISGFTDDLGYQFRSEALPVIVFGDHTKAIKYIDFPFAMGADGVKVLKATADCDSRYLYHFLRQAKIPDAGYSRHFKFLKDLEIPLPSLPEQRRIATILDTADALRIKRRDVVVKLDQLIHSVFVDMFGNPATNSMGWPMVNLGSLGDWKSGGTPSRANPSYFNGDTPWFSSGELNDTYISNSVEKISEIALRESAAKLMPSGSLMIGMYDTAAFKSSITTVPSACNQAIAFSHLDSERAEVLYVYQALQVGKEHFKRLRRGVRQKNLNLSMVRSTELPLPPRDMQRRFADVFKCVRGRLVEYQDSLECSERLFHSLQAQFFNLADSRLPS